MTLFGGLLVALSVLPLLVVILQRGFNFSKLSIPNKEGVPSIIMSTIYKHSRYDSDKASAEAILDSWQRMKDYVDLLKEYGAETNKDFTKSIKDVNVLLDRHKIVALRYYRTSACSNHRQDVKNSIATLNSSFRNIQIDNEVTAESIYNQRSKTEVLSTNHLMAITVHKSNLEKCDIIRIHNHKAVPLKDMSMSLMELLKNLQGRDGVEDLRSDALQQLRSLSEVIDESMEDLQTYDSRSFVNRKLDINRNLLNELKNSQYVDVLKIEKL